MVRGFMLLLGVMGIHRKEGREGTPESSGLGTHRRPEREKKPEVTPTRSRPPIRRQTDVSADWGRRQAGALLGGPAKIAGSASLRGPPPLRLFRSFCEFPW